MYFPQNREFSSALSKLWNFGEGLNPPNPPSWYTTATDEAKLTQKQILCTSDGLKNLRDILPYENKETDAFLCYFSEFQHALSRKRELKMLEKREHWLDYADDKYDKTLINDTKATLRVLFLYLPLPFFWALYDQQVSMLIYAGLW
jgi:hypothetical protein